MRAANAGRTRGLTLALLVWASSGAARAQFPFPGSAPAPTPVPAEEPEADVYGRDTPRGTLFGFLRAVERGNLRTATEYLEIPPSQRAHGEPIARELKNVFDHRFVTANLDRVSRSLRGSTDDGLDENLEKIGELRGDAGLVDVLAVRRDRADGSHVWLISWGTVREARRLHGALRLLDLDSRLPPFLVETRVGGMSLFQALGAVLLLPVLYGVSWILVGLVLGAVRRIRKTPQARWIGWGSARSPATFILTLVLHRLGVAWLGLPALYRLWYDRVLLVLIFIGLLWLLSRLIDAFDRRLLARFAPAGAGADHPTLGLARRMLKIAAFLVVVLLALASFGVNLTATLAGLGIGGIALAFAAQKSLGNIFGGIAVLADRALRVGDVCRVGGQLGMIEDITLWAIRIRTNDRTVVSIPNGVVMESQIENLSRRDKFWFHPTLGLVYETTPEQMRRILEGSRRLLAADPRVDPDARVRFEKFGASSLDVQVFAYVRAADYPAFLEVQEELLLGLFDLVDEVGSSLAYPTQTVHLQADPARPAPAETRA